MRYSLEMINRLASDDPAAFVRDCTERYEARISKAADRICENMEKSPVVLLSGPSGSGKTTTAMKLEAELDRRGIETHTVSMDNYFKSVDLKTAPRTPDGEIDHESPLCLDMDLLNEHFSMLARGEEIRIPHFVFTWQKRSSSRFTRMRLQKNELAIFEGIHAFNDAITDKHPEAFNLYISAGSDFDCGQQVFKSEWVRLVRRAVRDHKFRGANAGSTLKYWGTVLRGEQKYILPCKYKADLELDSTLEFELSVLKGFALPLFERAANTDHRNPELAEILDLLSRFCDIDPAFVGPDSLLCEFIGGGTYSS